MKLVRRQRQDKGGLAGSRGGGDLGRIRNEIDRLFEDPFSLWASNTSFFEGWSPALDIFEDKDRYVVKAELPGMKKEDIELSLEGGTLTISGERKRESEKKEGDTYRAERYFGRFQRSVTLPARVEPNNVQATYKDGILTVNIPKTEESKPKHIEVKNS